MLVSVITFIKCTQAVTYPLYTLGKSTFERLMVGVFRVKVFNVNPESSRAFSASAFMDRPPGAIWLAPEVTRSTTQGFHANDLNMILEGSLHKSVSRKNKNQIVS